MTDAFLSRRALLLTAAASAVPLRAFAADDPLNLAGTMQQGSLMVGRTKPGARVTLDGRRLDVSPGGVFCFGFAHNRTKPAHLVLRFKDGTRRARLLTPKTRQYHVQRINGLPQKEVTPPPEILARIHREAQSIRKERRHDTAGIGFAEKFDWPAPGIISSVYGSQRILNGTPMAPHLGIDIAAPTGTPIRAPADAIVVMAADYYLDGGFTLLDHGHGVNTCYLHQSKRFVKVGQRIARGAVIGEMGQTGRATGPNLHWGLNWFEMALDPSLWTTTAKPPKG